MTRVLSVLRRLVFIAGAAALLAMLNTSLLLAHPTATSFVIVTVTGPHTATIDITTDAKALSLKLEALGGQAAFLQLVTLEADTGAVSLVLDSATKLDDDAERVRVRIAATLPENVRTLTWRSSLFLGSYPLLIRGGHPSDPTDADAYEWLNGNERSRSHSLSDLNVRRGWWARFVRTVGLGFTHILPGGLDHVLFVCGLFLLAGGTRALLLQISAFTVAHSATLAVASLGVISVPAAIVEPLIALSIAYVAIENLVTSPHSGLSRWRLAIVFGFGLLHGLGFAGALLDLGVSQPELPATLVGFNVGVELGQIAVIVLAAVVVRLLPVPVNRRRQWVTVPASAVIAGMGMVWAVQRAVS